MDEAALQKLEEIERTTSNFLDLIKQADQALEQANALCDNYKSAHPNYHKADEFVQALHDIRELVSRFTEKDSTLRGQIAEAKTEAEQAEEEVYGS